MSLNKRKQINSKRSTEALILNMDQLAPEILFHIAKFLTPDEICNLRLTSNFFRNICDSEVIWHWLCKKQFGVTLSEVRYQDVVTYKKNHIQNREEKPGNNKSTDAQWILKPKFTTLREEGGLGIRVLEADILIMSKC